MVLHNLIGTSILVVEDDYMLACDLAGALAAHGSEIVGPFPDLANGLDALDNADVDAAVIDVRLRDERVFPLADRLWRSNVPFIIITGYQIRDIPDRFDDIRLMVKPVDTAEMALALATSVGEHRSGILTEEPGI